MKEVVIKLIRSDNHEFVLDNSTWGITALSGFQIENNTLYTTNNAFGDGALYNGSRIGTMDRTVKAELMNKNLSEIMRRVTLSFFNPKYTFKLYITYQGQTMWCEGRLAGISLPQINVYKPLELTFTLLSTMPYMLSVDNFGKNIASVTPCYGFPFVSLIDRGFRVGVYDFADHVLIENDGDVETFFQCVITATDTVVNPKIMKDSNFVRIIDTMVAGDVYIIDFINQPNTVKKNGVNAINKVDKNSLFAKMDLNVGDNEISFTADTGTSNMEVVLYYNKRYLGL